MFVSVIIPTYNYGKYLSESLRSALEQSRPPDEVIVVDDGSTDNTPEIMQVFLSDPRVKYIRLDQNRGVSTAKNLAIQRSRGNVIAFLDADDIWRLDKLQLQLPLFANPRVGVVYSLREFFDETGIIAHQHVKVFRGDVLRALMTHNIVSFSSSVVRRECFERAGLFDPGLTQAEDLDLWLRIAAEGYEFDYVNEPLAKHRTGHMRASHHVQKRKECVERIFTRFFRDAKYKPRVTGRMKRLAWAAFLSKQGYGYCEEGRRTASLRAYLRAIAQDPFYTLAWRGLAKCLLPSTLVLRLRGRFQSGTG